MSEQADGYPRMFNSQFPNDQRRWFVFERGGDVWIRVAPTDGIQNLGRRSPPSIETVEPFPSLFISEDFATQWKMEGGKPVRIEPLEAKR